MDWCKTVLRWFFPCPHCLRNLRCRRARSNRSAFRVPHSAFGRLRAPRSTLARFTVLCLVFLLTLPSVASADPPPIQSAAEIDYPPFSIVDSNGQADGFSVELLRAALKAMNREVTFRTGPWAEVRGWLENGEVQALPLVGRTPEREALFDFTFAYMTLHGAIVVRQDNQAIHNMGDLRGKQVAVLKGDNAEEFLRREDRGIHIHTTPTFEVALRQLSQGRYDAVVIQRLVALRLIQEMGLTNLKVLERPIEGFRQDFCFAVKEGDRDTLALLNEGLSIVMADGTYRHLHAKWFAALQLPSDRPIVVGGDHNYPPFEYLDERGRPAGYNVDLTRAIAAQMGLDVTFRLGPWDQVVREMEQGKVDVMQGMFYLPERDLKFDFTPPHMVNHYVSVVRRGEGEPPAALADLKGKRIVVQRGDAAHDFLVEKGFGGQLFIAETQEEVLREIAEGNHDCAFAVRISALYLKEKGGWKNLVLSRQAFLPLQYCYAAPNGHKAILAQFSEGLKILEKSGEYRRIYDKWLGSYKERPPSLISALRYSAMVLVPLVVILLAIFLWSWTLRRQVADRTRKLRESVDRFQYVFEAANVGKSITLPTGEVNANQAFADFLGYTQEELKDKKWQDLTPEEDVEAVEKITASLISGEKITARFEKRYVHKNGGILWADVSTTLRRDTDGASLYFVTTIVDITEKKRAEAALRASEEFQRAMIACSPVALYSIDLDGNVQAWNESAEKIFGWSAQEVIGKPLPIVPEDKKDEFSTLRKRVIESGGFSGVEVVRQRKDGSLFDASLSVSPIHDPRGNIVGIMSSMEDITQRKQAETALRKSEIRYRSLFHHSLDAFLLTAPDGSILDANPAACEMFGMTAEEIKGRGRNGLVDMSDPRVQKGLEERQQKRKAHGEITMLRGDGTRFPVEISSAIYADENGQQRSSMIIRDITERKRAEDDLREIEARYSAFINSSPDLIFVKDEEGRHIVANKALADFFGRSQEDVLGLTDFDLMPADAAAACRASDQKALEVRSVVISRETVGDRVYQTSKFPVALKNGKVGVGGFIREVTEQERLEKQLQQAQKLESVGRLAGGVAHDFNNKLSVILGYTELAIEVLDRENPAYANLQQVMKAGKQSVDIVRQLLAFARKQTIAPRVLDLNETVEGMLKMLRRLIGEDIDLAWEPDTNLWPVKIDPAQVDQILANLCVNARDAISGVGKVTIETENVVLDENYCAERAGFVPGAYVMLGVSDNGCGMDRETLANAFEPFFTTKEVGKGTGLGLATVYGIAKQNNGFVNIYSEPGKGTSVKIYLPRHSEAPEEEVEAVEAEMVHGHGETILVVEDETSVLRLSERILEKIGYNVLTASTPVEAVATARDHGGEIHLLITDVVLPEMSGKDLAGEIQQIRPNIGVLFMSGYTANVIAHQGVLDEGVLFMEKPFTFENLARKVKEALGARNAEVGTRS
jgi:PAS domain S-box-containing protein